MNVNVSRSYKNATIEETSSPIFEAEKSLDISMEKAQQISVVFLPSNVTPLNVYEMELRRAGYAEEHIAEIVDGLSESPLYDSKTT